MSAALTPGDAKPDGASPDTTSERTSVDLVPTSFGVFKPVGWVMMGLPTQAQAEALAAELQAAGWQSEGVLHFTPRETLPELEAMVDGAGAAAGFGYEITLLRRYVSLTKAGCRWLLVKADDLQKATAAAEAGRGCGATLAVYYRTLTVEELI